MSLSSCNLFVSDPVLDVMLSTLLLIDVAQDYDCFYAQVFENRDPSLKSMPLGVRQKNILATCNYNARKLGVKKLMLVSEARKLCKGLVLVDGEDLSPFRDMSKILFNFLRSYSWNDKAERLGFDEVFMGERQCS